MTQPSEQSIRKACEEAGVVYSEDWGCAWRASLLLVVLALARRIEAGARQNVVVKTLDRAILFSSYRKDDPLAIRFEFSRDEDRLAAANAIDAALARMVVLNKGGE